MQHHSGEHIVSGLAHTMYGCDNVGFHMGADVITIDFNVELSQEQVRELEAAANRYIWGDHPVQITYPSPEELAHLEYRSKKAIEGQVRIVSFLGAGHLRLLRHPRVLLRPGGAGEAALLPKIPLRRTHRAGVRRPGLRPSVPGMGAEPPDLQPHLRQAAGDRPGGGAAAGGEPGPQVPHPHPGGRPFCRLGPTVPGSGGRGPL